MASNQELPVNESDPLLGPAESDKRPLELRVANETSCSLVESDRVKDNLSRSRRLLYLSHFFSQFTDCSWQFSLVFFLAAFTNYDSLILVSTYGLVSGLSVCIFGAAAGRFIDSNNRLFAARCFIWAENICVLMATTFCYRLLTQQQVDKLANPESDEANVAATLGWFKSRFDGVPLDAWSISLLIAIHLLGAAAQLFCRGFLVAIERDWVVVMSTHASSTYGQSLHAGSNNGLIDNAEKNWLSDTNVAMKQIDLSCKVGSPAIAGFIIAAFDSSGDSSHGSGLRGAALLVGGLNIFALIVEYVCTARIYHMIPELAVKDFSTSESKENGNGEVDYEEGTADQGRNRAGIDSVGCEFCKLPSGLRVYLDQPIISWGGMSFALLYLNALTFGPLMTAYLAWRQMRFESIGIWRGVSSAVGLLGTVVYHFSVQNMSIETTGLWSIVFQFTCLSVSYASLFLKEFNASLAMLIAGVCTSRVGLWVFDISITQLMQEYVPAQVRGTVGGVQQALNAFFGLLTFVLGIFFPKPDEFHIYVTAGYVCVGMAMLMYSFGVHYHRDKLRRSL